MSTQLLYYGLYLAPLLLVLWFYVRRHRRARTIHVTRLQDAVAQGLTEPATLHPVIDPRKCLGSGACVKACPEQALGIIDGKGYLVNASACIGHGACMAACPHDAIRLVFGTERRGVDIPLVKPDFETNVPGIFIAGELGGMGLIRKAVEQGRQAIESIAKRRNGAFPLDVLIVGAGPAGISASLGAMQHKLRFVTVEQEDSFGGTVYHYPRNKIVMTAPAELPLFGKMKMGEVSKEKLLEFWQGVLKQTGLAINFFERLETIRRDGGGFVVNTCCSRSAAGERPANSAFPARSNRKSSIVWSIPNSTAVATCWWSAAATARSRRHWRWPAWPARRWRFHIAAMRSGA